MPSKPASVRYYTLKITLAHVEPPVWRRIVISGDRTLAHLDVAIQAAMGWSHSHLHQFLTRDGTYYSDPAFELHDCEDEKRTKIKDVLPRVRSRLQFEYDLGDSWGHDVVVEKVTSEHDGPEPRCLAGEGACPPEDVGGPFGYAEFVAAINDPQHERHDELVEWHGAEEFDPTQLDLEQINRRLARPPRLARWGL